MIRVSLFRDLPEERRLSMEIYADRLAEGLRKHFTPELEIDEVKLVPGGGAEVGDGHPRGVAARWSAGVRRFVTYPRVARSLQGDVNHIIDHSYADLAFRLDRRRTVVTCHDLVLLKREVLALNPKGYSRLAMNRFRWYSLRGLERASHVIAISESTRRDLAEHTRCSPDRIAVIPYGVGRSFCPHPDAAQVGSARRRLGIPEGPTVLHVGHVDFYKNIEGLMRIFAEVSARMSGRLGLVRVGQRMTPAQREITCRLGLDGHVHEVGPLPHEELAWVYRTATVFLFPSLYEGFGMPPLEAMASGVPVVASHSGSLGEVLGDAGMLHPPGDESGMAADVCALLRNEALRRQMAEKGLRRARLFSWERNAEMTRAVYADVLRNGGRA